jgi:hypothetical protein
MVKMFPSIKFASFPNQDFHKAHNLKGENIGPDAWSIVILRYFNPVGSHSSGLIGQTSLKEMKPTFIYLFIF